MIHIHQPGGAGIDQPNDTKVGVLCYLSFEGPPISWGWSLEVPDGSNARLSAFQSPYPNFAPDVPGTYKVHFVEHSGKVHHLTVKAG